MKTCSFCGKPTPRYATTARDPWAVNYHCFRLWCRMVRAVKIWGKNVTRGLRAGGKR